MGGAIMGANFDERDFASVIIEDTLKEKAASTTMFQDKQREQTQITRNKFISLFCILFSVIYLASMILATVFVQQDYEDTFDANMAAIKEIVTSNGSVNSISVLSLAQDERQMFSAAVYDADGKLVAVTKPSLVFVSEEGNTYYFPLEDYFDDSQIQELLVYGRGTSEPYLIEAKMEIESEKLLSLKLTSKSTGQKNIVWQWENKQDTSDIQEETYQFSRSMPVRQMLSVPYYEEEKTYEKWVNNEYLQGFESELREEERKTTASYETFTVSKSNVENITEVTYINDLGEEETYFVAIRSVGNTLAASMKLFIPVYIVGLVLTLGGIFLVVSKKQDFL